MLKIKGKKVPVFILKTLLWILMVIFSLLVLAIITLQIPATQHYLTTKITGYLSKKINSKVELGKISIGFPKDISLSDIYVEDLHSDTLLYAHSLKLNFNFFDLFSKKLILKNIHIENLTAHVYRAFPDTTFNYSFIPAAFTDKEKTPAPKDTTNGFQFSIEDVSLNTIFLTYKDTLTGSNASLRLGEFNTSFDVFNLDQLKIAINSVNLKNSTVFIAQNKALKINTTASKPFMLDLGVKQISLTNLKFTYLDANNKQDLRADLGRLNIAANKVDLQKELIDLKNISLSESAIVYALNKTITADTVAKVVTQKEPDTHEKKSNWTIKLAQLELNNNAIAYNNNNAAPQSSGMDFNHLLIHGLNMYSNDIFFSPEKISMHVKDFNLHEEHGFVLKQFTTQLTYDATHVELSKLFIETDKSQVKDYLAIHFKSIKTMKDSIGSLQPTIHLKSTRIALSDVLMFQPDLLKNSKLTVDPSMSIQLNSAIHGTVDNLLIDQFELSALTATAVHLKGSLKNVRQPKLFYADVQLTKLQSSKEDIVGALPKKIIPSNIRIPDNISLTGIFKGYVKNFDGNLKMHTSIGDAFVNIKMDPSRGNNEQPYAGSLIVNRFDLGRLLNNPELLGPISMNASLVGKGLTDTSLHANLTATITEAVFKKYHYKELEIAGIIDKKSFDGTACINDSNLVFNYKGLIDLDSAHPAYNFTFNLVGADLKALQLTPDDLRISTNITADLRKEGRENIIGSAIIKDLLLVKEEQKYLFDSLSFSSLYKDDKAVISLTSEFLDANLNGDITLKQLPAALKKHFGTYFNLQLPDTLEKLAHQKFNFEINLTDPTMFTEGFIPKLEKLSPFSLKGAYDNEAKNISLNVSLPQVVYSKIIIDSLLINTFSNAEKLTTLVRVAEISNPTVKLENIHFGTDIKNNKISFNINTLKDDSTKMLSVAGVLTSLNNKFKLQLNSPMLLNTVDWTVDSSNYIEFSKTGVIANNVFIKHEQQGISISSLEKLEQAPLELTFTSFELGTLSKIIENKKELANGSLTGKVILKKENNLPSFTSDLTIKGFSFNSVPFGDIKLLADNEKNPKIYHTDLTVTGNENNLQLNGYYNTEAPATALNFNLIIRQLNLTTVEPYTFGQVTHLSGTLTGKMDINGSTASPDVKGIVNFNSCAFNPKVLDSYLRIENGKIDLESKKIRFNSFTLVDSLSNKAVIDGYVDIQNLKVIPFDLRLKSDNFLALHTTEADNPLYFGTIYLDSDIKLTGTTDHPKINAKIGLNKGTVITYVKPENSAGKNDSKGIVEFTDTVKSNAIMTRKKSSEHSTTKGINLNALIKFNKDAELKMLVDRVAGDSLYVKGSGQLEFSLDEGGKTNLIGKYRMTEGGYHLTINEFIKKNFSIDRGSSVTWSGDVTDPFVDIRAIYKIKASPVDLVQDQLTGADQLERNKYRTLMNFLVYLKMNGFVSTPEISFDIQQPANERGALNGAVNAKLSQLREDESQLNKQVFALLTLNRFISEDPLESGGASGLASTSRASASRILTQQLSNLSEKYVKGVDLNLGVNSYEDYSSGQEEGRTQLQVGVSKKLLNDKVTVQVGGNVDIEGEKAKQNNASNVAGNISIEYKLTDDGRYKLKGFRKNEYENPIEGELIKTGFGVMYKRDYTKLRELLSKPKRSQKVKE